MGPPALAAISLIVTIGGTAATVVQQRKAAKESRRAQNLQVRQAEIENQRRIRQAIAAGRADRARTVAAGQAQVGGFGGSAQLGAIGAADTQLASNVGFARQTQAFNASINRALQRASQATQRAGEFQAIAGLPAQFGLGVGDVIGNLGSRAKKGETTS